MESVYKVLPVVNVKWVLNETTVKLFIYAQQRRRFITLKPHNGMQAILIKTNCFLYRRAKES